MATMSEDALFKALLKNKPPQQQPKPAAAQNIPVRDAPRPSPAAQPVERYQIEEPQIETKTTPVVKPMDLEPVVDSIDRLNSSVNMIYGLVKNIIAPVFILILVTSIAMLIRTK
jgi:hypothetical protein